MSETSDQPVVEESTSEDFIVELERSNDQGKLFAALAKAQGSFETIEATEYNDYYGNKYAPLWKIWEAIRGPLSDNALVVIQEPEASRDGIMLRTTLGHSSGEWRMSRIFMPITLTKEGQKRAPAYGSALSYARRYALSAIVGVATQAEDDDAGGAEGGAYRSPRTLEEREEKGWKAWADSEALRLKDAQTLVHLEGWWIGLKDKLQQLNCPDVIPDMLERIYLERKRELQAKEKGKGKAKIGMESTGDVDEDIPQ